MVRLSEIMKSGQLKVALPGGVTSNLKEQPVTLLVTPSAQAVATPPLAPREVPEPAPSGINSQDSEALYRELLDECQRSMDEAGDEQEFTIGNIPTLTERLVDRLASDDPELVRLTTTGEGGFSLASKGVNVAILAVRVGMEFDFKKPELVDLALAGLFHDIGMIKIHHLIHSPTHLGPEQLRQVREHPVWGHRLLQHCPELKPSVRGVILQEHERHDGSGYPHGLSGGSIHDHAQVVGLLDSYEALTHDRPYRKRLLPSDAMRTMVQDQRTAFRHDLLRAFIEGVPIYPVDSWIQLSSGESAKVIANHPKTSLSPIVSILVGRDGQPRVHPDTVDLSKESHLAVVRAVPEPILS